MACVELKKINKTFGNIEIIPCVDLRVSLDAEPERLHVSDALPTPGHLQRLVPKII